MEPPKTKATAFANGLSQNQFRGEKDSRNKVSTAIQLSEEQIERIVGRLSPRANQERRFIEQLGRHPLSPTKVCCRAIACVNLSNLRARTADLLASFGLEAKCIPPSTPIKNAFGERGGEVLWALFEIEGGGHEL